MRTSCFTVLILVCFNAVDSALTERSGLVFTELTMAPDTNPASRGFQLLVWILFFHVYFPLFIFPVYSAVA